MMSRKSKMMIFFHCLLYVELLYLQYIRYRKWGDGDMAGGENDFAGERTVKYVLLNKDVVIAEFEVDVIFDTIAVVGQFVELPYWFDDIGNFIDRKSVV